MILTVGERRIEYPIINPQDAIEFAQAYSTDPAALFDLVNCRIEGDGADWVRDALKGCIYGLGNDSHDQLLGLLNMISNREWIERAPHARDLPRLDVPVLCVASGPSLDTHMEALLELQNKCLIICADTAIGGLRKRGIYPHIATPVERDASLKHHIAPGGLITYGGSLYAEREVTRSFYNHVLMPSDESLGAWADDNGFGYGSSTGTASVMLGLVLSSGPIYLIGHDISFGGAGSHWTGATCPHTGADDTCLGNDGKIHATSHWFKIFRDQIATFARNNPRIFNVNILEQVGAVIPNTLPCLMPDMDALPSFHWHPVKTTPTPWRAAWPKRIKSLPSDLRRARDLIHRAQTLEQVSGEVIMGGDNLNVALALFRPIYIQYSIERRLGLAPMSVFLGVRDAMLNVLDRSLPIIEGACRG